MDKRVYRILTSIPIIGPIIDVNLIDLSYAHRMMDDLPSEIRNYLKEHPNEQLTKGLIKKIYKK